MSFIKDLADFASGKIVPMRGTIINEALLA
jgi:hypothetical protein